ncbi:hypothetical protein AwErysi_07460 [Erysipelotrichaceae bacterium]|nr:hypothetical protein AwErysi_07460 [Erysipelotrichaceae bacterium]
MKTLAMSLLSIVIFSMGGLAPEKTGEGTVEIMPITAELSQEEQENSIPELEIIGEDFTIKSSDAKKMTREFAQDDKHADIQFENLLAKINLYAILEVDPSQLATINKGEVGVYPLTFTVSFNNILYSKIVMVTVEKEGVSPLIIFGLAVVIGMTVMSIRKAKKK